MKTAMSRVVVHTAKTDTGDCSKLHEESQPEAPEARRDYGFAIVCMQASRPVTEAYLEEYAVSGFRLRRGYGGADVGGAVSRRMDEPRHV